MVVVGFLKTYFEVVMVVFECLLTPNVNFMVGWRIIMKVRNSWARLTGPVCILAFSSWKRHRISFGRSDSSLQPAYRPVGKLLISFLLPDNNLRFLLIRYCVRNHFSKFSNHLTYAQCLLCIHNMPLFDLCFQIDSHYWFIIIMFDMCKLQVSTSQCNTKHMAPL